MLSLFRRHIASCPQTGKRGPECKGKPKCPIHYRGVDGRGRVVKPQALKDPLSGASVREWGRAVDIIRELDSPTAQQTKDKPLTSLSTATKEYMLTLAHSGPDHRRKTLAILTRMQAFLATREKTTVEETTLLDLQAFRAEWTDAQTTCNRNLESMRTFFRWCIDVDMIARSPAAKLKRIKEDDPKPDPFTLQEVDSILFTAPHLQDEYGRQSQAIASQTYAFVLVMRYTGLSIGDTAKLEKSAINGSYIRTHRKKTGKFVLCKVPDFVLSALASCPHDSDRYFFWSGRGLLHTRTSKWGDRLQRLFALANVRVTETGKQKRVGGKLNGRVVPVKVSSATPHMFRHTFARDMLTRGHTLEDVADLLGNSMRVVERYYSRWDPSRQEHVDQATSDLWSSDPLTARLIASGADTHGRKQLPV